MQFLILKWVNLKDYWLDIHKTSLLWNLCHHFRFSLVLQWIVQSVFGAWDHYLWNYKMFVWKDFKIYLGLQIRMFKVFLQDFMSGKMIIWKVFENFVDSQVKCFYLQLIGFSNKILYFRFKSLNKFGKMNLARSSKMKFLQEDRKQIKNIKWFWMVKFIKTS